MSCERTDSVLHGYFDQELDAEGAAEFERHLEDCAECAEALAGLKSLRAMDFARLYERAPERLRRKVAAEIGPGRPVEAKPSRSAWQWLAIAAALLLVAYTGWRAVTVRRVDKVEMALAGEVIDAHLRSLQPGHLADVISTDQHTVKPWFDGKVDFAPPVHDFAEQGFPLQGGRLDVVNGRATAALVYGRRKHVMNVFMWPMNAPDAVPRAGSRQGYQWMEWRKGGMEYWVVSDTAAGDVEELQRLMAE